MATPDPLEPTIIMQDRWLVVVDKPSGLLSVPGIGPEKADCLVKRLQRNAPGARIVHRLDRDTSGVMVLALDAETHRSLSMQFERRETEKRDAALCAGHIDANDGTIDLPIRKGMLGSALQIVDHEHGRASVTHWSVLERLDAPRRTRVLLAPVTGRSHQLRVHLKEIGHPILGDELYAPPSVHALSSRLCLHASSLSFTHPATGTRERFESTCPF